MKIKNQLSVQRLVGKIDNDFNISESDWIPRVAAWVIDALSQMKVLPMVKKRRTLEVTEKVAQFPCELNAKEIKVFDTNGCEIQHREGKSCKCRHEEIAVIDNSNTTGINFMRVGTIVNNCNRYFTLDGNNIILNFDADHIIVESLEVATYYDEYYNCECPYIYDNGLLLEALAWYVLFKYLSRGSKHPVYDLKSPNAAINPFVQWNTLKPKAAASVKIDLANDKGWRNFFYNSTFDPRNN